MWVIDTNVVLDLLHFDDAVARPILDALESERIGAAATAESLEELRRVLAYPEFALDHASQAAMFDRYQALSMTLETPAAAGPLPLKGTPARCAMESGLSHMPRCSDPDDQKFLELAAATGAQVLVSKDRALLKLRRRCAPHFLILAPADAVRELERQSA